MNCRCATCGNIRRSGTEPEQDRKTQLRRRLTKLKKDQEELEARLTACLVEQGRIQKELEE